MTPAAIVSKLWNYCNVLRDDGMSYGDYGEQLTELLGVRSILLDFSQIGRKSSGVDHVLLSEAFPDCGLRKKTKSIFLRVRSVDTALDQIQQKFLR
jgi:hypothetical protein